ncbi:hypothetical protein VDG1235_4706 [Verrucomicrobiia bacterium DG1235]|nr:hypothetical protein VDG1235_4706 [Verrucomicrobiae bacterium DG1235]
MASPGGFGFWEMVWFGRGLGVMICLRRALMVGFGFGGRWVGDGGFGARGKGVVSLVATVGETREAQSDV